MRYLMRDGAPLTDEQWARIDEAVVGEAKQILIGRRFLDVSIVGHQTQNVPLDTLAAGNAAKADFWARDDGDAIGVSDRRFVELTSVYADFTVSWRDVESERGAGVQAAREAAVLTARREDDLIFYGDKTLGMDGIFTVKGSNEIPISDWESGEAPVMDIAKALSVLAEKGNAGEKALIVSTDLYAKLHRIQSGAGVMEVERVRGLVGNLYFSTRLNANSACLVYCEPQYMDLVIGQDMITAYMGNEKLDHVFRVMETLVPRFKRPQAIALLR